jgi:hypothetical protein
MLAQAIIYVPFDCLLQIFFFLAPTRDKENPQTYAKIVLFGYYYYLK